MFTGIVEAVAEVARIEASAGGRTLWLDAPVLADAALGASVSVNGVCLTVAGRDGGLVRLDVMAETVARSAFGSLETGDAVNLERPLRAGDELGGHVVQGHVDGVGRVSAVSHEGSSRRLAVDVEPSLARYMVEKGSVTVNGVSLTLTAVGETTFEVALIPHTLEATNLGRLDVGSAVNVEVDVLAKYVEKLTAGWSRRARADADVGVSASETDGYL